MSKIYIQWYMGSFIVLYALGTIGVSPFSYNFIGDTITNIHAFFSSLVGAIVPTLVGGTIHVIIRFLVDKFK